MTNNIRKNEMTKTNTKTTQERITALEARMAVIEKEVKEVRWLANYNLYDFSKTQGEVSVYSDWIKDMRERLDKIERELEAEDNLLPPTLSPEEEKEREDLDRWHRIGI